MASRGVVIETGGGHEQLMLDLQAADRGHGEQPASVGWDAAGALGQNVVKGGGERARGRLRRGQQLLGEERVAVGTSEDSVQQVAPGLRSGQ